MACKLIHALSIFPTFSNLAWERELDYRSPIGYCLFFVLIHSDVIASETSNNRLVACFSEYVFMTIGAIMYFRLSKAAVSRYKKLKEQSTAGLKDIVAHHKYTEVGIHTHA